MSTISRYLKADNMQHKPFKHQQHSVQLYEYVALSYFTSLHAQLKRVHVLPPCKLNHVFLLSFIDHNISSKVFLNTPPKGTSYRGQVSYFQGCTPLFTCKALEMLNRYAMTTVAPPKKNSPSNQVVPNRQVNTAHALAQYLTNRKTMHLAINGFKTY